ncbi:DEAD/DEAH box helicase [Spirulina subsalsa FACHB-351]|uniref:DEAD/DEAH box helicase n=1 Tax=Spirulina subsalsa FACHB-351 TaxID=234711 RepID=A0ABT3L943_9CYAN|nr:DEAD/DEAH box helicase [Spirulina subsalsa]MCW6037480.1 DEAD/DEAH box helicase [Spirulina subsalsa FACHB-351]
MAILHGSWILEAQSGYFFLWGETWRTQGEGELGQGVKGVANHPLAMSGEEVLKCARSRKLVLPEGDGGDWMTYQVVALPSRGGQRRKRGKKGADSGGDEIFPVLSGDSEEIRDISSLSLQWWALPGLRLTPAIAIPFLQSVPLGSIQLRQVYLGDSLKFWAQVYRWSLDLLARGKFLPGLTVDGNNQAYSQWQPLLDSAIDQGRLSRFLEWMPSVCRAYINPEERWEKPNWDDDWITPQSLLFAFLGTMVDSQLRQWVELKGQHSSDVIATAWLESLAQPLTSLRESPETLHRLKTALDSWKAPVQDYLVTPKDEKLAGNSFRTSFVLQPPTTGEINWGKLEWKLNYYLHAVNDPSFMVEASTIWENPVEELNLEGYTIENPQEILLRGLGIAARIYEPIRESLLHPYPTRCVLDPIQVYAFLRSSYWQLQDTGFTVDLPPGLAGGADEKRLGIKFSAAVNPKQADRLGLQSLLKYKLELAIGDQTVSAEEFERLLEQKSPLVQVNGEWLALQPADVRAAQSILASKNEELTFTVEDALRLSTGDTKVLEKLPVVKFEASGVLKELIANLTENKRIESADPPEGFKGELRPYQARGVGWLRFLERWGLGACLADDMGLGKTIETIAFLLSLKQDNRLNNPTLLVCPTSVLGNWERELRKFAPTLSVLVHHGDKRDKGKTFVKAAQKKELVITSYSLVYRDLQTLETLQWEGVILDEAQNIKNAQAKQSQAVRSLSANFRIALTGTPVENRLTELWSILEFLNPGFLGTKQFFQHRFAIPIEKYGDRDSLSSLRSLVQPFILRRLKTDKAIIQDLPDKQEMNVFCGLSSEQGTLYQQLVDESLMAIEEAEGIQRHGLILTLLLKLKQVCNHPSLLLKEKSLGRGDRSGKVLRLQEMLEEVIAEGDRALIFTQFAEWGKLLQPYLEYKLNTDVLFLYGSTKREQREIMVDRFQNDSDGPQILILSLKAGGTGLNLTRANHVFHVDRWWNPAVENQATDRAFRIGQKRNVQVHKFVCTGTLEEKINDIIESKKQLAEQTVDAGEQWLTEMNTDQLRSLLILDRSAIMDEEK